VAIDGGQVYYYWGNYSYYKEKVQESGRASLKKQDSQAVSVDARQRMAVKELERNRRRLERQLNILEEEITQAENRTAELENLLADPAIYSQEQLARNYNDEYTLLRRQVEQLYEHWASLNVELEGL